MKKILIYSTIIVFSIVQFSCNDDFLNTKPLDKFSEEDVWNDANMAQGFVYETYKSVIPTLYKNPLDDNRGATQDDFTDNIAVRGNSVVAKDQMDKYFDAGWNQFATIRKCNLIIDKVSNSTGIPENARPGLIAQGKVLRALIYYRQARLFGKYVLIDKVLTQEDDLKLPRTNTIKETYDFIITDLKDAAPDLPENASAGQITKGVAYAMLAEIALQGAAYIESGKEDYYQIAKKASEDLFELGFYELDDSYADLCNDFNHAFNSKEVILAYFMHEDVTYTKFTAQQTIVPNCSQPKNYPWVQPPLVESIEGWAGRWPSNQLVNDYLVVDADGKAKKWDETTYYQNFVDNGGAVSQAIYKNRDLRFYASVAHDSSMYYNNLITIRVGGNMHWDSNSSGNWAMTRSGYYFRKGVYENKKLWANDNTPYHYHIMRLGRAYLNYAEVMLRLNQVDKAIEYINKVRTTHGGLPALNAGLSSSETWENYRRERRVELFFENDRYWSLLRWGKEAGDIIIPELNSGQTAIEIAEDGMSFEIIPLANSASENERAFSVKRYLFPVPEKERLQNENLDQNPGW